MAKKSTTAQRIGRQIKEARKEMGITQQKLAELAGLRRATVVDLEAGKLNFELNTLEKVCKELSLSIQLHEIPG